MQVSFSQIRPFWQSPVLWHFCPSGESDPESCFSLDRFQLHLLVGTHVALLLGGETRIFLTLKTVDTVTGALALLTELGLGRLLEINLSASILDFCG